MKIIKKILSFFIIFLAIAAVAIWQCPASLGYRYLGDRLSSVKLNGLSGSIWNGQANELTVLGQPIGTVNWQLQALPLLDKKIVTHLNLKNDALEIRGQIIHTLDGQFFFRDVTFQIPAEIAALAINTSSLKLLGRVEGRIEQATWREGRIEQTIGHALWKDAGVSGNLTANFGELEAEFSSLPDGSIAGVVNDKGSALSATGTFQLQAGKIDVTARLSARDNEPHIQEVLRHVGIPQTDGSSLINFHSELFK